MAITDSTFTGDSAPEGGGLFITANGATIAGDVFEGDSAGANGVGGGLAADLAATGSTLSGSVFKGDTASDGGGGADISLDGSGGVSMTITGNTFSHDSVADPSGVSTLFFGYSGGGLALGGFGAEPTTVLQSENNFDSDSISFKAAPAMATGGGEAVEGAILESTRDRFTDNTLQSPSAIENTSKERVFGWGAGLSVIACGDRETLPAVGPNLRSTLADAVVAGNTLLSGPSANGAGIYVGSFACHSSYAELALSDSTVAGNVVSGASGPIAGISGGPKDVLSLANTIVNGDGGGAEIGGFNGLTAVSAAFSDVCSGAAPLAGTGNICADPLLVAPGPGGADVSETAASPTLERGSNALIPAGLTTDAFGAPRVLGPTVCAASQAAIVDIGAAELAYAPATCPPPASPVVQPTAPTLSNLGQTAKTWREGKLLAQLSSTRQKGRKRPPVGTTFSFKLDRPAQVTFAFTHATRGRKVGRRCLAQTHKNRRKHRCTRTVIAGALGFSAHAGTNKVRFQGLISKRRKLTPGGYTLLVTAIAAGKRSRTGSLRFTIVR